MFPPIAFLKNNLLRWLDTLNEQGLDISAMKEKVPLLPDSYDAVLSFAKEVSCLPMRRDWQYVEPLDWTDIENEMDKNRQTLVTKNIDIDLCSRKVEAGFLASVLGCILGKPLEVDPSLAELKAAGLSCNEWPISDFVSENFLQALGKRNPSWTDTIRGNINYVAADDDINYSLMGMINLENYGLDLDLDGVKNTWLKHQCLKSVFGPERYLLACVGLNHLYAQNDEEHKNNDYYYEWSNIFNPGSELCGAAIRADAYGFAFPGRPDLAAKCAFTDASFTHRRTGVYSTVFVAAAIALMFNAKDPLSAFEGALKFVPQRSRFFYNTKLCLEYVKTSSSFDDAYQKIHQRFIDYGHCKIYQEIGTLINTLHYAEGIWDGVCKQVMQGNDTDSFGCTAGSLLGVYYGPGELPHDKLAVFNDDIRVSLAYFHERSLFALARRMGELPVRFSKEA